MKWPVSFPLSATRKPPSVSVTLAVTFLILLALAVLVRWYTS